MVLMKSKRIRTNSNASFALSPGIKDDLLYAINPLFGDISLENERETIQLTSLELDDALQTYDRLMNTNPTDPKYYLRAGRTYANAGNCNDASPWLQEGYELEQALEEPNLERLAAFEEFLISCGVPLNRVYSTSENATAEPGA